MNRRDDVKRPGSGSKDTGGNGAGGNGAGKDAGEERAFDWAAARQRMMDVAAELGNGDSALSPEEMAAIWAQRAARFAQTPVEEDEEAHIDVVVIRLGREHFGVEAQHVFRIRPIDQVTPVPRTPAWIVGVANERGRILSVFDLRQFLNLPEAAETPAAQDDEAERSLVIVESEEMELAMITDGVLDIQSLPQSRVQTTTQALRGIPPAYVLGVADTVEQGPEAAQNNGAPEPNAVAGNGTRANVPESLVILDLPALLADERLIVREELV
jgi:purine-binding chemotaxis protein CheW